MAHRRYESPWGEREPLLEFVRRHLDPRTGRWPAHVDLPDEPTDTEALRYAPGARDGIMSFHGASDDPASAARTVAGLLGKVIAGPSSRALSVLRGLAVGSPTRALSLLHAYTLEHPTFDYVDHLHHELRELSEQQYVRLAGLGEFLVRCAPDRELLKLGIALTGYTHAANDLHPELLALASHDEFSLPAMVAAGFATSDRDVILGFCRDVARRTTGWGRVQALRLVDSVLGPDGTLGPEDRDWLLREGHVNDIMLEYTAAICARRGGLFEAISRPEPDDELIGGCAMILSSMAAGGPVAPFEGYDRGPQSVSRLLDLLREHPAPRCEWLPLVDTVCGFASGGSAPQAEGWTTDLAEQLRAEFAALCSRPEMRAAVEAGLGAADLIRFNTAARAAPLVGIDAWEARFARPPTEDHYYELLRTDDPSRLDRVLDHALSYIDLASVATGPDTQLGVGPGFEAHRRLDWFLQALAAWPGKGEPLIRAGLRSPVTRNRSFAYRALAAWSTELRRGFKDDLERAAREEPDERLFEYIVVARAGLG